MTTATTKTYQIGEKIRDSKNIDRIDGKETITVTRRDDAQWNAQYIIADETENRRGEWNKIRKGCMGDDGLEPLLLRNGETDTYTIRTGEYFISVDGIKKYKIANYNNWTVTEVL